MVGYAEIRIADSEGEPPQVLKVAGDECFDVRLKRLLKMLKDKYGVIYIQFPNEH